MLRLPRRPQHLEVSAGEGVSSAPLSLQGFSASGDPLSVPRTLSTGLSTSGVGVGRARPPGDRSGDPVLLRRAAAHPAQDPPLSGTRWGSWVQARSAPRSPRSWGWGKLRALSAVGAGGRWAPALRGGGERTSRETLPLRVDQGASGTGGGGQRGWGVPRRKGEAQGALRGT